MKTESEIKNKVEIIPNAQNNKLGHLMLICAANDYDIIYNKVMRMTDGDQEIAGDVANWCGIANVGEIYEFREGTIQIKEAS